MLIKAERAGRNVTAMNAGDGEEGRERIVGDQLLLRTGVVTSQSVLNITSANRRYA